MEQPNFIIDGNAIRLRAEDGSVLAEVTFPTCDEGIVEIDHTFVDSSLRGQGTAGNFWTPACTSSSAPDAAHGPPVATRCAGSRSTPSGLISSPNGSWHLAALGDGDRVLRSALLAPSPQ